MSNTTNPLLAAFNYNIINKVYKSLDSAFQRMNTENKGFHYSHSGRSKTFKHNQRIQRKRRK